MNLGVSQASSKQGHCFTCTVCRGTILLKDEQFVDAFAVVYLPKADTLNTSYDTYVGSVNLNGFVQPVRFYRASAVAASPVLATIGMSVRPSV